MLVEGTTVLLATGEPRQDVLTAVDEEPVLAGFAWPEAEERLSGALLVGAERMGSGTLVVFAQVLPPLLARDDAAAAQRAALRTEHGLGGGGRERGE